VSEADPQFLPTPKHRLAYRAIRGEGPPVVWCGGFGSDMDSTKAQALAEWAEARGRAYVRFDYSGHGLSEGRFADGTIGQWYGDACAIIEALCDEAPIIVGSSMGGWIALLVTRALAGTPRAPKGLVLIAPAGRRSMRRIRRQSPAGSSRTAAVISCLAGSSAPMRPPISCRAWPIRTCPGGRRSNLSST